MDNHTTRPTIKGTIGLNYTLSVATTIPLGGCYNCYGISSISRRNHGFCGCDSTVSITAKGSEVR